VFRDIIKQLLRESSKAFGQKTYYVVDFGLTAFYSCTVKIRQILQKVY
jgi:hypothetical protein